LLLVYCAHPASKYRYVVEELASQLGRVRTNVGMLGQMLLLYWAICSSVAGEIILPPHRLARCGSSMR
jgi:hypothetical protein